MQLITTQTRTYIILVVASMIVAASFVVFYLGYREQIEINSALYKDEDRKERLHQVQANLNKAGVESRDYILTGISSSMVTAFSAMTSADSLLDRLRQAHPEQSSYSRLESLIAEGRQQLVRIDSTYQLHGRATAAGIYEEHGFRLFRQDIGTTMQALKLEASNQYNELLHKAKIIRTRNIIGFMLLFFVSVCILLMLWLYFRSTEQRLAAKRALLMENIERQEQSEQLLQGGYFEWIADKNQLIWSKGIYSIFELPDNSPVPDINWALEQIKDPREREIIRSWMQEPSRSSRLSMQIRIETPTGKEKILQMEGYPSNIMVAGNQVKRRGVIQDVTQRILAEKENTQLAGIIENSLNEVYIFDEETLLFDYVNKGALQNIGYVREEMKRMTPLDINPAYDLGRYNELLMPLRAGQEDLLIFNTVHRRKDGSLYHVEVHLQLMNFRNKKVFTAIIIDVSAAVESARQLKEVNENLQRRNKELNQFASVTAHDLQEPLRMVRSFTTLLENKYGDQLDDKARQYIHYAADGSKRMQILINDILEYSRAGGKAYEMSAVNIHELFGTIQHDIRLTAEKSRAVLNFPPMNGITVWGNPNWLYRLFINLLTNGLKFKRPGLSPSLTVSVEDKGLLYLFCLEDNGIGISAGFLDQLFLPYHRLHTREEYEGTGLGLAICKKIVDQHQGSIWVESKEGEGSRFYIELKKHTA